jgi:glycolate oxidase FAD binding subunit
MATLRPADMAEVEAAIQESFAKRESLEIVGTGSKRAVGRPSEARHVMDLSLISGIDSYEPEELVLSAKAATSIAEISQRLAEKRQMLAFEPPDFSQLLGTGWGSIGGVFATNLSGPRRIKSGAARDFILGFSGVSGRGNKFRAGGRVVKNVTGYDLSKLMCGSWGTLAVLGEVTLKVMPAPEFEISMGILGLTHGEAVKAMTLALQSSAEVSAAAHVPARNGASRTMLRLEGVETSVKARARMLEELLKPLGTPSVLDEQGSKSFWQGIWDVAPLDSFSEHHIWRISTPASRSPEVISGVLKTVDAKWYCDWGGGLIWLAVTPKPDAQAEKIRSALAPAGGHATLIRAPAKVRRSVEVFQPQETALAELTRRVKLSFDPGRVLNKSRMYEGV